MSLGKGIKVQVYLELISVYQEKVNKFIVIKI